MADIDIARPVPLCLQILMNLILIIPAYEGGYK